MNIISELDKYDELLIISSNQYKDKLIDFFSMQKKLRNIIYKTPYEVSSEVLGKYDKEARIKLAKLDNISIELAEIKLKNSLLVEFNNFTSSKLLELINIRERFKDYLKINPLALNLYKNKQIVVINNFNLNDEFLLALKTIKKINPKIEELYTYEDMNSKLDVFEFNNYKDEVLSLLKNIGELLEKKVDSNLIKVHLPSEYYSYAKEVFSLANIDLNFDDAISLSEFEISKNILKSLENLKTLNIKEAFSLLIEKYKQNSPIMDKIINIFNSYLKYESLYIKDIFEDLVYTLSKTTYSQNYIGGIRVCNILDEVIVSNDYVFILGLNQDVFPKTYKDEEYILDFEREKLGLLLSSYKNREVTKKIKYIFKNIKNLYISYSHNLPTSTMPLSSIISKLKNEFNVNIIKQTLNSKKSYSKKIDQLNLAKALDLFYKYDVKSDDLYILYNEYSEALYKSYDNQFSGVSKEILNNYLKNGITLSYTAIDKFNKCSFLFYIENILKIRRQSNEESLFIGNLIHFVLYKVIKEEAVVNLVDFMKFAVKEYVVNQEIILSKKDEFFINKYINTLSYLLDFIKNHNSNSEFKVFGLEKEFNLTLDLEVPIRLNGKIDKILTLEINHTKYAIVVDYKSGSTDFDLNRIVHGLNMQIMFYFYFLNNQDGEKYEFAGGYLQPVMPSSTFGYLKDKTYLDQLYDYFKLVGYSSSNLNVLRKIDKDIETESKFIQGIRFTKDGGFHANTFKKIIDDDQFADLLDLTNKKIKESAQRIINGEFKINPKLIGNNFDSCKYCQYKDLCYKSNSNYEELAEFKQFEFIGGKDDSN